MRNSRESSNNGHNTSLGEAISPDPKEQSEASFAHVVGPVMRLDDVLKHFEENGRAVDRKDLIVLTTADGTLVCPEQQFERTDEAGNRTLEVSPYTIALWRVTGLSGHNGWTRAASLADPKYEINGHQCSLLDIVTNPEIADEDKRSVLQYVLDEEDERVAWNGDPDFNKKREEVVAYIKNDLGVSVEE